MKSRFGKIHLASRLNVAVAAFLGLGAFAFADDYSVWVNTSNLSASSPSFELFDSAGNGTLIYGSWTDTDTTVSGYSRFQITFYGITPGDYSIALNNGTATYWSGLSNLQSELGLETFSSGSAPTVPPPPTATTLSGDYIITGNLDVEGSVFNFGTQYSGGVGHRFSFDSNSSIFESRLGSEMDPWNYNYSKWIWTAPTTAYPTGAASPNVMELDTNGKLTLRSAYYNQGITLDPFSGSITIDSGGNYSQSVVTTGGAGTIFATPTTVASSIQSALAGSLAPSTLSVGGDKVTVNSLGNIAMSATGGTKTFGVNSSIAGSGTDLSIKAGGAGTANFWGGSLLLSSGAVKYAPQDPNPNVQSVITFSTANGAVVGGQPLPRMTINGLGAVGIGEGAFSGTMYGGAGGLDVASGGVPGTLILGAENNLTTRTNNRSKVARVSVAHYNSNELGFAAFSAYSVGNDAVPTTPNAAAWANYLQIGGGTGVLNAATDVSIWTGATATTPVGTKRLTVTNIGRVGIGTEAPAEMFEVAGNGRFSGASPIVLDTVNGTITINGNPVALTGQFTGIETTAATRSAVIGYMSSATGEDSIAFGRETSASGLRSISMSYDGEASGEDAVAVGTSTVANNVRSLAMMGSATGIDSTGIRGFASADFSLALGHGAQASGIGSTALGRNSQASGFGSVGIGEDAWASGDAAFAIGGSLEASGAMSIALGFSSVARGDSSIVIGTSLEANNHQMVVGRHNDPTTDDSGDRKQGVFVVGAGTAETKKNAMRITDDGVILIQPQGDISMGEFMSGEQP